MNKKALQFNFQYELVNKFILFDDLLFDFFQSEYGACCFINGHMCSTKTSLTKTFSNDKIIDRKLLNFNFLFISGPNLNVFFDIFNVSKLFRAMKRNFKASLFFRLNILWR